LYNDLEDEGGHSYDLASNESHLSYGDEDDEDDEDDEI
jgi:hypothetical protein